MRTIRRLIAWERRVGVPANVFMAALYEWVFVVLGPGAIAFGAYALSEHDWIAGVVMTASGVWMTWLAWARLSRFLRTLARRQR